MKYAGSWGKTFYYDLPSKRIIPEKFVYILPREAGREVIACIIRI
jgi:hypothetical protein